MNTAIASKKVSQHQYNKIGFILDVPNEAIASIEVWQHVYYVRMVKGRNQFVSKSLVSDRKNPPTKSTYVIHKCGYAPKEYFEYSYMELSPYKVRELRLAGVVTKESYKDAVEAVEALNYPEGYQGITPKPIANNNHQLIKFRSSAITLVINK